MEDIDYELDATSDNFDLENESNDESLRTDDDKKDCVEDNKELSPNLESTGILNISPKGTKTWTPDVDDEEKPKVHQKFNSFEEARNFYMAYASKGGFETRKSTSRKLKNGNGYGRKYVLCNREGKKKQASYDTLDDTKKRKRKRPSQMIGCMACIRVKLVEGGLWEIYHFHEKHNHPLVHGNDMLYLKSQRKLTYSQKQTVHDVSRVNIGPCRAFNIMKESRGGFEKVGATKTDAKNFKRDYNAYIGDNDADMVIDKFNKKVEFFKDFSFEYCVGDDGSLNGLFWADEDAKRNYFAFGDVVGFDATYRTNKYFMIFIPFTGIDNHKRCVTFAAGLLSSESVESYTWLLNCFKKTFGREPNVIVTDQDPAMKQAVPNVFSTARHRLCMWHISEKFKKKLGTKLAKTDVLKRLHGLIWNENIKEDEFDNEWKILMDEYKLNKNKWFNAMFEMRDKWIPAYFRDCQFSGLMKTTSRSEAENYFYGLLTNADLHLVEFVSNFESALEAQRYVQKKNDHDSRYTNPEMKTGLKIEQDAAKFYTRSVFYDVQNEIVASINNCMSMTYVEDGGWTKATIKDTNENEKYSGQYEVSFNKEEHKLLCSCMRFELTGHLCRHCFYVLRMSRVDHLPKEYVSSRWTKDVVKRGSNGYGIRKCNKDYDEDDIQSMVREIYFSVDFSIDRLVGDRDKLRSYWNSQKKLKEEVEVQTLNEEPMTNNEVIESFIGAKRKEGVTIKAPLGIRNKGSGSYKKRLKGKKEIAVEMAKKKK